MAKKHPTVYAYIDASNFYGGMATLLPNGKYFDFGDLAANIVEDFGVSKIKVYGTFLADEPTATKKRKQFIRAQNKFFQAARNVAIVEFHKGYFSKSSGKEKGIDVMMAVDMVKDAYEKSYDEAVILTGDDDFLYALKCIKAHGNKVHLLALASRFPFGLGHNTSRKVIYDYNNHFTDIVLPKINRPVSTLVIKDITNTVAVLEA